MGVQWRVGQLDDKKYFSRGIFVDDKVDLRVDEFFYFVVFAGYQAQNRQEGLDVIQSSLFVFQFLLFRSLVDVGEYIGFGVIEYVEEWFILGSVL